MNKWVYVGIALLALNVFALTVAFLFAADARNNDFAIAWLLVGTLVNTAVPAFAWLYQLAK